MDLRKEEKKLKLALLLVILDFIIVVGATVWAKLNPPKKQLAQTEPITASEASSNDADIDIISSETTTEITTEEEPVNQYEVFTINMNFIGDLLLATNQGQAYENCFSQVADEQPPEYFLSNVSDIFLNDDLTVGDCENVFSDSTELYMSDKGQAQADAEYQAQVAAAQAAGEPIPANTFQAFWFKSKASNANIIKVGGVDVVSIDNNHINDYGTQGKEDTKKALEDAGVEWGNINKTVYRDVNGFKIAIIFGSMYGSGAEANMIANLNEAKTQSDYQIVYFHGGTEAIHEPESWKVNAAHNMVDNGADLVLGDHPHVLQPMEEYNGVTIVYSLGNFCFGGHKHPENRTIIFNETLTVTKDIANNTYEITDKTNDITPCYVYTGDINNWQPAIIENEEEINKVLDFMNQNTSSPL